MRQDDPHNPTDLATLLDAVRPIARITDLEGRAEPSDWFAELDDPNETDWALAVAQAARNLQSLLVLADSNDALRFGD